MDRQYKYALKYAVSPYASENSAHSPVDRRNSKRNTNGVSFLRCYAAWYCNILFQGNGMSPALVNPVAFGELMVIICHIGAEPSIARFWSAIHPRIAKVSRELYTDGHCSTAAEKAVKEVESRLREKFSELKPSAAVPSKIGDVIGALMSENGAFKFCDTTTTSGRDYRRGIQSLFEGIMAAYRNPAAHANLQYEKREAMEQIMLASQLMYVLDKPQL